MIFKALKKAVKQLYPQRIPVSKIREKLVHEIAVLGGKLFGDVPANHERLFYTRDRRTVVWKEGNITTYYQSTPEGIVKTQDGQPAERISDLEAQRLRQALYSYRNTALTYLQSLTTKS